ncbi:hypothetical protein DIJ62_09140, partial [Burkholderia pseudomallei]
MKRRGGARRTALPGAHATGTERARIILVAPRFLVASRPAARPGAACLVARPPSSRTSVLPLSLIPTSRLPPIPTLRTTGAPSP